MEEKTERPPAFLRVGLKKGGCLSIPPLYMVREGLGFRFWFQAPNLLSFF